MPSIRSALGCAATVALAASTLADALVLPTRDQVQAAFSLPDQGTLTHAAHKAFDILDDSWNLLRSVVDENGKQFEVLTHPALPDYKLRVTEPKLCDTTVQQYSGYFDIGDDKHLWFWFFEARKKPEKAPTVLWLNGGPGCSSSTGLLFELGPCNIRANQTTEFNPYSWTETANVIFLDQPINVGYSYSDTGKVNTSPVAAEDVFSFLELFFARYKKYAKNEFHISGESYAGTYLPNIANVIHQHSQSLALLGEEAPLPVINFASVLIGNGLTDPRIQFGTGVYDYACESKYAVFDKDGPECANLASKGPQCARLIESCYKTDSRFSCVPAALYCWSQMFGDFNKLGLNPYDVRKKCDREGEDGPLCYRQMGWIEEYLNQEDVKRELGVSPELEFKSCNMQVNQDFMFQGDGMKHSAALLPPLLEAGIRVLIYAGVEDFMCNFKGNLEWVEDLDNVFKAEFNAAKTNPYVLLGGKKQKGEVKVAGAQGFTAGNLAYVSVFEAGHMVPFDQPEVALDLFSRWIHNTPLVLGKPE